MTVKAYEFIRGRLPRTENPRILEVGAGNGVFWKKYGRHLADKVKMVDVEPLFEQVERGDANDLHFKAGSFTHVVANYLVEQAGNRQKTLSEISRMLEKGGTALLLSRHPDDGDLARQAGARQFTMARLFRFFEAAEQRGLGKKELKELEAIVKPVPDEVRGLAQMAGAKKFVTYLESVLSGKKTPFIQEIVEGYRNVLSRQRPDLLQDRGDIRENQRKFVGSHFMDEEHIKSELAKAGLVPTEIKLIQEESDGVTRKTWGIVAKKK